MEKKTKMLRIIKRLVYVLLAFMLVLLLLSYFTQRWLEYNIDDVINAKEDRAYNVSYENLELNPFFKGFKLERVSIQPLNKFDGAIITCTIDKVEIKGLDWVNLLINNEASIAEISFVSPDFELRLAEADTSKQLPSRQIQEFFGDILSRANLNSFRLVDGSFILLQQTEQVLEIGHVGKINFEAKDIETDSVQWNYLIPFKLSEFSSSLEEIYFMVDENTSLRCGSIKYQPQQSNITVNDISLALNKPWTEVADKIGKQSDIFELDIKTIFIKGLATNSYLIGSFNLQSDAIIVDHLVLKDYKNKNLPIGKESVKPMFLKMIASIPFDLKIDTILINNSFVEYTELGKGKSKQGTVHIDDLDGKVYGFTTIDSLQKLNKRLIINLKGKLNKQGKLNLSLTIPYDRDEFRLNAQLKDFDMKALNTTITPMLGVVVESGDLALLDFDMWASNVKSQNKMIMHYSNLKLTVLDEDNSKKKKRGLISSVANTMIRDKNKPGEKHYVEAVYKTKRNQYKAPFNFIWFSVQDGLKEIVPSKMAKELMENNDKKATKKRRKKKDKK